MLVRIHCSTLLCMKISFPLNVIDDAFRNVNFKRTYSYITLNWCCINHSPLVTVLVVTYYLISSLTQIISVNTS